MVFSLEKGKGKQKGFLLTEAILSLFILTIGLTSVVALISSSLRDSFSSRDTIIAVELVQEGVELVRNVRDNGFLASPPSPFGSFDPTKKHCRIAYNVVLDCRAVMQGASSYSLQYVSGFYTYGASDKFSRYVYVEYNGTDQAIVKSFVYWGAVPNFGNNGDTSVCTVVNKCVFTQITLTNWRG